jgi:NADH-quinone oxidoreductase subunit M
VIGVFTIVITAGYILWLLQRVFFGAERPEWQHLSDASRLEVTTVGILVTTIVAIGLFPGLIGTPIISGIVPIAARYLT